MKTYKFTAAERQAERKHIIHMIGVNEYRKLVAIKWNVRRITRQYYN
jgi:hypothetical protein